MMSRANHGSSLKKLGDFGKAGPRRLKLFRVTPALVKADGARHDGLGLDQQLFMLGVGHDGGESDQPFGQVF